MAGGFMRGGMRPKTSSPGRDPFPKKSGSSHMPMPPHMPPSPSAMGADKPEHSGAGEETRIIHHPNGEHEVHHADGEVSKHPNSGHMAAHIHAKHMSGEVGNMHSDGMGGPVTTHHVGPDGEVSGPVEHGTPEEGAGHLASMMSVGMENEGGEPDEYSGTVG